MPKRAALFCLPALMGCTPGQQEGAQPRPVPPVAGPACNAAELQNHLGHTATAQSGATLLKLSGARTLRWGPPDSAWTMDYRPDRLNVRYDRAMTITEITCG